MVENEQVLNLSATDVVSNKSFFGNRIDTGVYETQNYR